MGREQRYVSYRSVKNPTEVVVIFKTHLRDGADSEAYRKTSRRMHELVEQIPGFISIKAYTAEDGEEIDLVRFANEEALERGRSSRTISRPSAAAATSSTIDTSSKRARWSGTTSSAFTH